MVDCTVDLAAFHSGGFLYLTNDDFTEDINENGRIDREEERTAKYIVLYKNTFVGNRHSAIQVTGENVLVSRNTATGSLAYFVGSDPRWADSCHDLTYQFYNFVILGNQVGRCAEAFFLMRNAAPLGTPRECQVPQMGRFVIKDNVIGACPRLVKAATLGVPARRDLATASGKAVFDGPNIAQDNLSDGTPITTPLDVSADAE